ncbi:hypothetical protein RJ639_004516 [Escallonia herrerae]|uniref:RING-type domain-containing protein n=1 Tax=Escallonia herrerae TaxID=1293975 RepID=A0AA88VYW6_9ASTE|nr:hypothetical protein RJ639_004516 [Escallonia herrerae]
MDERDRSGDASTSTAEERHRHPHRREAEEEVEVYGDRRHPRLVGRHTGVSYDAQFSTPDNEGMTRIRDDTWSCIIVVLTFWFFVSMTLILGVYGSVSLRLGPNTSLLIESNPLLVDYLKVQQVDDNMDGPTLYGFYEVPPLDVVTTWSKTLISSLQGDSDKASCFYDWIFYLNHGSKIDISYSVNSSSSSSLILVIAQGNEGLAQWLDDPSYPNTTLSWNLIHGNGLIQQDISKSSSYYIAVGNLNLETVEVQLNLTIRALQYNTTAAYFNCNFARGQCTLKTSFPNGNAAVLATPPPKQASPFSLKFLPCVLRDILRYAELLAAGTSGDEWYVKVSYGPRWITYLVGICGLTILMLLAFHFLNNFRRTRDDRLGAQFGEMGSARTPLLSQKEDDLLSWGSSYDSVSQDDEESEDGFIAGSLDGEYNNNTRRLCAICFDAPRDCFFLPCGHCVACYACGTRIAEAAGTCPICRKNMKKVRRIFTV